MSDNSALGGLALGIFGITVVYWLAIALAVAPVMGGLAVAFGVLGLLYGIRAYYKHGMALCQEGRYFRALLLLLGPGMAFVGLVLGRAWVRLGNRTLHQIGYDWMYTNRFHHDGWETLGILGFAVVIGLGFMLLGAVWFSILTVCSAESKKMKLPLSCLLAVVPWVVWGFVWGWFVGIQPSIAS